MTVESRADVCKRNSHTSKTVTEKLNADGQRSGANGHPTRRLREQAGAADRTCVRPSVYGPGKEHGSVSQSAGQSDATVPTAPLPALRFLEPRGVFLP